jgi:hypothetical protein
MKQTRETFKNDALKRSEFSRCVLKVQRQVEIFNFRTQIFEIPHVRFVKFTHIWLCKRWNKARRKSQAKTNNENWNTNKTKHRIKTDWQKKAICWTKNP